MRMTRLRPIHIIVIVLTLIAGASVGVSAQEGTPTPSPELTGITAFEIYPKGKMLGDYFAPTIEAGDSEELVVVLANTGDVVFEGRTYATNVFTAINGGFGVADQGVEPEGVTLWLDYPETVHTIQPGTGLEVTFTISVPEGTEPGQYITALVFENAESQAIEGAENFSQIIRFPVPVFITVPGPVEPGFEVGEVNLVTEEARAMIQAEITNTGNVRIRPEGTLTVSDNAGKQFFSAPITMQSVYARDETLLQVELPGLLPAGKYHVAIELEDPETKVTAETEATITSAPTASPVAEAAVQIFGATGTPRPDLENIQFLDVSLTIANNGEALTNVRVMLRVSRDDELVEEFPIASSLALPSGETPVQARYIPMTGWESGTWQFEFSVETVDPDSQVAQVVATDSLDDIVVP
jgi:hypothetical protein